MMKLDDVVVPKAGLNTLGDRLAWARQAAGLSVGQVAKLLRCPREEVDASSTNREELRSRCHLYNVGLHWMETGELDPFMVGHLEALPGFDTVQEPDRTRLRLWAGTSPTLGDQGLTSELLAEIIHKVDQLP